MIAGISLVDSLIQVNVLEVSLKTTKCFTHGRIVFDMKERTVAFGTLPPVRIPDGLILSCGAVLDFQFVAPNGAHKQTRTGVLKSSERNPDVMRIAGASKTPPKFATTEGWGNAIYKFRAYFSHPGLKTDADLPNWLKGSIARQKALWNRMAWLCREARRKCSPVPAEEIAGFVENTVLPAIDAFNGSIGRSKDKMRHPTKLKSTTPSLDNLWALVGELRRRVAMGRQVPDGLVEKVVEFSQQFRPDYTPFKEFSTRFQVIAEREASILSLRRFEIRPTVAASKAALDRHKTIKASWSDSWPLIKYPDSPKAGN
jgi:hypothetical protein